MLGRLSSLLHQAIDQAAEFSSQIVRNPCSFMFTCLYKCVIS